MSSGTFSSYNNVEGLKTTTDLQVELMDIREPYEKRKVEYRKIISNILDEVLIDKEELMERKSDFMEVIMESEEIIAVSDLFQDYIHEKLRDYILNKSDEFLGDTSSSSIEFEEKEIEKEGKSVMVVELLTSKKDYTVDELWKEVSDKLSREDYEKLLTQLEKEDKIHIEKDGYISWLWNPDLVADLKKRNLMLD